ncbi:hypothetical protein CapIbe_000359 [Capra ibex]
MRIPIRRGLNLQLAALSCKQQSGSSVRKSLSWKITCDGCHSGPCSFTAASPEQDAAHTESVDQIARWSLGTRRSSNTDTADESTVMGHVVKGEKQ